MKQDGTDYHYVTSLARRVGCGVLPRSRAQARKSLAYWGPDLTNCSAAPSRRSASISTAAPTSIAQLHLRRHARQHYLVTIIEPNTQFPIPIPFPSIDLLQGPHAANAPTPLHSEQPDTRSPTRRSARRSGRPRQAVREPPTSSPPRPARRPAVRPGVQGPTACAVRGAGAYLRRTLLRQVRHARHQARRIQAEFLAWREADRLSVPTVTA